MSAPSVASTDILDWLKFAVTAAAPFVALGGAVWMYFIKQSSERADIARRERQVIYRNYLTALKEVSKLLSKRQVNSEEMMNAAFEVFSFHNELAVFAPDAVVDAVQQLSSKITETTNLMIAKNLTAGDLPAPTVDQKKVIKEMLVSLYAPQRLVVQAMRADVLVGSKIDLSGPQFLIPTRQDEQEISK